MKDEKHQYASIRAVKNGWEVDVNQRMSDVRCLSDVYVFETWASLVAWLKANLQNNER